MERRGGEARPKLLEEGLATQIAELRADLSGQDLQAAARSGRWAGQKVAGCLHGICGNNTCSSTARLLEVGGLDLQCV